jgi:eukaryotic-like serine/threonine-protein kinase
MIGKTLAHYEITGLLGKGGMGEVYRARDTKLDREVAIKLLPPDLARDPERLARFRREARVLALLNHPNIAAIHGLEDVEGHSFLVMELAEGDDLSVRLARGPLPLEDALSLALQLTAGLEEAHEKNIVHRDLKPANIMIGRDGKAMILDFGLARAFTSESADAQDLENSPTITGAMTLAGTILGTAAYMSPEQARGKTVDKRSDIWAFGCCLYEALSGKRPFTGETMADVLAQIIELEPDWNALPNETPARIRILLWRCLQKDPRRRLRDIGEARFEIGETSSDPSGTVPALGPTVEEPGITRTRLVASVLAAVVLSGLAVGLAVWKLESSPATQPEPIRRYSINLSPDAPLQPMEADGSGTDMALSPDGLLLVYVADTGPNQHQLFLCRLNQLDDARPIAGTENAVSAFFSPDSQWIGFVTHDKLKKVSVQGGSPTTLCDITTDLGASWGEDGHIVFSSGMGSGLKRISAAGGPVEDLMDESFMQSHGLLMAGAPVVLPGGKSVLFMHVAGLSMNEVRIAALTLETGEVKFLVDGAVPDSYHPTGHLSYVQERAVMAVPFDPGTLEITGPAVPVTEENMTLFPQFNVPILFDFSAEGTLVYVPGSEDSPEVSAARTLVWVDREGNAEPIHAPPRPYREVDLSPDGTRVAVRFNDPLDFSDQEDIWILDLTREPVTQQRLTNEPQGAWAPVWTPDGQRVVFGSMQDRGFNLLSKAANGTGPAQSLYVSRNPLSASTWSADGRTLIFHQTIDPGASTGNYSDIWALSLDGEPTARPLLAEAYGELHPAISPDGRWIAYETHEINIPGGHNIYIRPFPNIDDGKWLISTRGGEYPVWAPDGRELYYWAYSGRMTAVRIETEPVFVVGNSEELFGGEYLTFTANRPFGISPDGQRFLMIKEDKETREAVETAPITELIVVDNWDEVLRSIASRSK